MQTTRHPQTDAPERRLAQVSPPDRGNGRRPPRRTRWFVALGFTLLAASAIGTGVVLRSHAHDGKAADTSPASGDNPAYGVGHVDSEERVAELYPRLPEGVPNIVTEVLVKENDFVKKGKPLLRLDSTQARFRRQAAQAELSASELKLDQAKEAVPQHESLIASQRKAIEASEAGLKTAQLELKDVERIYGLKDAQLISKPKRDIAEETVGQARKKVEFEQTKLTVLEKRVATLQLEIARAKEEVVGKQALLDQAKFAEELCELKAPFDGKVLRLTVAVGQLLGPQPREPILYFCPDTPRIIRAEIDQEFANQIQVGQPVIITDDATLTGSIRGKVKRISDWFAQRRSPLFEPRQLNDVRTLECIIEVDPAQAKDLRIGQRVRVKIEKK
ncbi:MAG: HlyD family efflux transporter periplasmic adaptor subunit [Planctomycetes bacterium]|nr:HlyD family efflux transporter periplasmic adaptor subunit [Planctomycetota bacterium]